MRTIEHWQRNPELWWTIPEIQEHLHVKRTTAYKLMGELPDAFKMIIVNTNTGKATIAGHAKALRSAQIGHRRRGNPRLHDPAFQAEMARRRHHKT